MSEPMTPADRLAQLIHDARDLAAYVSDGPMRNQPTVAQMGALLAQLADAVEQRVVSPTDPPVTTAAYDGYRGNLTPLSDIAASAVDLGPANLSTTFRERRGPTDPDLRAALERTLQAIQRANHLLDTLVTREGVGVDAAQRIPHAQIILSGALTDLRTRAALQDSRPEKIGCPECGGLAAHWGSCSKSPERRELPKPSPRARKPRPSPEEISRRLADNSGAALKENREPDRIEGELDIESLDPLTFAARCDQCGAKVVIHTTSRLPENRA